jgi:hypothetical protein
LIVSDCVRGNLDDIVIRFRALSSDVPVAARVRRLLRYAHRACQLRNEGISDPPGDAPPTAELPPQREDSST